MEGLRKLEEMQSTMMFMESRGLISAHFPNSNPNCSESNSDSDRFLANLFLFMTQPCGELKIDDKCRLISESLPKLCTALLEESLLEESCLLRGRNDNLGGSLSVDQAVEKACHDACLIGLNNMGMIGLDAMQRANSTLEDFCRSYFMFHGMDVSRATTIFRYLPVLCFTESYIYQLDTLNEQMLLFYGRRPTPSDKGFYSETKANSASNFGKLSESDPFHPLILLLERHGLFTERIGKELRHGEKYWALERKLCGALLHKMEISIEDALMAIEMKSFDYRVLNLLLYELRKAEVNELHMEFLSVSELLVEIADDMFDYEEDVVDNHFNILRMFVSVYGTSTAPTMLAKCISEAEEKYDRLLKALDPEVSSCYQRRCEEATKEGGKLSGHSLGSWTMPPLIADEESYRSMLRDSSQSVRGAKEVSCFIDGGFHIPC